MYLKKWKKYVLSVMMAGCMVAVLSACGANAGGVAEQKDDQVTNNTPVVEESTEPTEEVKQPEAEVEVETTEDVEEPTEETTPEEPKVEMVDFETWATQADNDEVCLVVWNELDERQEILPTLQESKKTYEIKDGDRFAIPYRENIIYIDYMDEKLMWENTEYLELSLEKTGSMFEVFIGYEDEDGDGKNESVCYSFK